jgi:hypothetical protein
MLVGYRCAFVKLPALQLLERSALDLELEADTT